jgi:pyridoxine kinase
VFGYAGNTAAIFPLQRLGREAWAVNTVEFSNHTGYGSWRGKTLGAELACELVKGLADRGALPRCEAVLSGYLGDPGVGQAVAEAVCMVKEASPNALYCCDPVMGDMGRGFYVKPEIPGIFKNELCPLADILTPNQFELEALTGIETGGIDNARKAICALHEKGPAVILVTSYREGKAAGSRGESQTESRISMLASDKAGLYRISTPELPLGDNVAGTGDLTASVFLSRFLETRDIKRALELSVASIFGILEKSLQGSLSCGYAGQGGKSVLELLLIEAQEELVCPSRTFEAEKLL